jgi:hypothetical protein
MPVTYAEIVRRAPVSVPEAVALVLAALRALGPPRARGTSHGLPSLDYILLSSNGRIHLSAVGEPATAADRVRQASLLLHTLLVRDDVIPQHLRGPVPGALLLLIARGTSQIALPVPTHAEFVKTLSRFGSMSGMTLAQVYRRCLGLHVVGSSTPSEISSHVVPIRRHWHAPSTRVRERRHNGLSVAELRRDLRDAERALFAALVRRNRVRFASVATAVALLMLATTVGLLFTSPANQHWALRIPAMRQTAPGAGAHSVPAVPRATAAGRAPDAVRDLGSPRSQAAQHAPAIPMAVLGADLVPGDVFSPSYAAGSGDLFFHAGRTPSALMRASFNDRGAPIVATVLKDGAANFHATLSPDGQHLAYDSDRDGSRAVYVAGGDGGDPHKVSGNEYAAVPRWSPDGHRLAFIRAEPKRPRVWNVWIWDLDTAALTRASSHGVGQAWGPSWFPDGRRIAYSIEDTLVIKNLQSGATHVIPSPLRGRLIRTPAVSPDGQSIVFQVYRDGAWLLDLPTRGMRRVLADKSAEEFAWTPDGSHVAYHAKHRGVWSVWQVDVARSAVS